MMTRVFHQAVNTGCTTAVECRQASHDAAQVEIIAIVVIGVLVLAFLLYAWQKAQSTARIEKRGTSAIARIEKVTPKIGGRRSNSEVDVYLDLVVPRPGGTEFTATVSALISLLDPPKVGWTVPVKYLESAGMYPELEIRGEFKSPVVEPAAASSPQLAAAGAVSPGAPTLAPVRDAVENRAEHAAPAAGPVPEHRFASVKPLGSTDPHRLGSFEVLGRVGSGGMGVVYLGRSRGGRLAAVKVVRSELADDAEFRARFSREIVAARQVSGAFTAPVLDADPDAERPWLATLFIDAPSLRARVSADGPLPPDEVRALGAGLAEALGELHRVGLVHRDVKPGNVLLAADGPRLIDFGIIRSDGLAELTESGIILGSAGYLAPEQATGEPTGPSADVFSLGAVLTFATTGHSPYGTGSAAALLTRTITGEPDLSDLPEGLGELVARCLARDPAERPGIQAVLDVLAG